MVEEWAEVEGGIRSEIRNQEFPPNPRNKIGHSFMINASPPREI
jgi:hypothetical protein